MLSHVTASMNGLTTIRAFNAETMLIQEFDDFQDAHSSAWYLFLASGRCFGFWLDMLCITFSAVGIYSLIAVNDGKYFVQLMFQIIIFMCIYRNQSWRYWFNYNPIYGFNIVITMGNETME